MKNLKIPPEWLIVLGILVIIILFCDNGFMDKDSLLPKAAVSPWTYLEPPETRIRMLWIIHGYVPKVNAGSEICAHTINKFFMDKPYKYDIWVASPGFPKITYENVRCFDLYDSDTFLKVLNTSNILHSHSYIYRNQMKYLCRKRGIPFVEWVHTDNYVRSIPKGKWIDSTIRDRHWTVFNSESLKNSRRDIPEKTTHIIHPIVDYHNYYIPEEDKTPKYITLSNVNENKGGKLLIQLAKALPEFQFMGILGGYRSQIVEHGIPNLQYVQNMTDIKKAYAHTWLQIMPSREETWGRTAVEAMSSGIPVIVHPTPGLRECCKDAAIYCDRDDSNEWISAIQRMKSDKEFYNSQSKKAYTRARELDPKQALDQMEQWIIDTVLPSKSNTNQTISQQESYLLFR
jgi:glycosyltransferase involved in cell wall biosynthesis